MIPTTVRSSLLVALVAACAPPLGRPDPTPLPDPRRTDVAVEVSSVTLADDCPDPTPAPAPADGRFAKPPQDSQRSSVSDEPASRSATPGYAPRRMMCEQTSMQLSLRASNGDALTLVRVKRVELFDADGRRIGELVARNATVWSEDGSYVPWDQSIAPAEVLSASYSLSAPDWSAVGGRLSAQAREFKVRVTFAVGDAKRVVEKHAHVAAMIEPHVVT